MKKSCSSFVIFVETKQGVSYNEKNKYRDRKVRKYENEILFNKAWRNRMEFTGHLPRVDRYSSFRGRAKASTVSAKTV